MFFRGPWLTTPKSYLRAIYNVNQTTSTWSLGPRELTPNVPGGNIPIIPRGVGNIVSREFNLLYRFHSVQSEKEAVSITEGFKKIFGDVDIPNLDGREFFMGLIKWMQSIDQDPRKRTIPGLVRNADGRYNDADLTGILSAAIDDPASMYI